MLQTSDPGLVQRERKEPTLRLLGHAEAESLLGAEVQVHPQLGAKTDVGCVRKRNEDQFLVATLQRSLTVLESSLDTPPSRVEGLPGLLLAVADGVGGVPGGDVASAVAIDTVADCFLSVLPWTTQAQPDPENLASGMREALEAGQIRLRQIAARKGLDLRLGTTLTVAYVAWPRMQILHIGDSRAYLLRNDTLTHLTRWSKLA
jgi:serine/threonine protein phosphatase PrpC